MQTIEIKAKHKEEARIKIRSTMPKRGGYKKKELTRGREKAEGRREVPKIVRGAGRRGLPIAVDN